jgi:threonine/homoserine/homoserine lactone efflux protein
MPKALSLFSLAVGALVLLLFLLDLALNIPFGLREMSIVADICFVIGAGMLSYIGWESFREQT